MSVVELTDQARTASRLLKMRGLRWDYFNHDLFDEHAWNMLLILFIAQAEGRSMNVANLCSDSGAAATTGPRWIRHLTESRLIEHDGEGDAALVVLTAMARAELADYLFEVQRMFED